MSKFMQTKRTSEGAASKDGNLFEQYGLLSLGELVLWLFRSRKSPAADEPEPFDEHMNGLA